MPLSEEDRNFIRSRCESWDLSFNAIFYPKQFLVGPFELRLKQDATLKISFNPRNKFYMRIEVVGEPSIGFRSKDVGITLTQFTHFAIKDGNEFSSPPAIIASLHRHALTTFLGNFDGLQSQFDKAVKKTNPNSVDNYFTFLLKPVEVTSEEELYMTIAFGQGANLREFKLDMPTVTDFFQNEFRSMWKRSLKSSKKLPLSNRTYELIEIFDPYHFAGFLNSIHRQMAICGSHDTRLVEVDQNPHGKKLLTNAWRDANERREKLIRMEVEKVAKDEQDNIIEQDLVYVDNVAVRKINHSTDNDRDVYVTVGNEALKRVNKSDLDDEMEIDVETVVEQASNEHKKKRATNRRVKKAPVKIVDTSPEKKRTRKEPIDQNNEVSESPMVCEPSTSQIKTSDEMTKDECEANEANFDNTLLTTLLSLGTAGVQQVIQSLPNLLQQPIPPLPSVNVTAQPPFPLALAQQPTVVPKVLQNQNKNGENGKGAVAKVAVLNKPLGKRNSQVVKRAQAAGEVEINSDGEDNEILPKGPDTKLFYFPPKGELIEYIDPVLITFKDVRTLDRKEFVNDNIMSFMLNYIACRMIKPELRKVTHLFNTFFYSNISRSIQPLAFSGRKPLDSNLQKMLIANCMRVIRWTKNFDLFKKDYIIIPINEDYHWLVVVIFNPFGSVVSVGNEEESRKKPKCYMVFFDPLSGLDSTKRKHMCHCIKSYLGEVYDKTKNPGQKFAEKEPTIYDPERVVVMRPENTPVQNNFYDCGLYALYYIEGLFCNLRPVTVNDFPNFDWAKLYPEGEKMAELMRDKVYNLVNKIAGRQGRTSLRRWEKRQKCGLSQEGDRRRSRRHSAPPMNRKKRNDEMYRRHFSLCPPSRGVIENPLFANPRILSSTPALRKVREKRLPEEGFPVVY